MKSLIRSGWLGFKLPKLSRRMSPMETPLTLAGRVLKVTGALLMGASAFYRPYSLICLAAAVLLASGKFSLFGYGGVN